MVVYTIAVIGVVLQRMDNKKSKENIYRRRKELGLSQECVAEQIDVSLNSYIKIEKGPTKIFNPKIVKIAEVLNTTPKNLIFGSVVTLEKHNQQCENITQYYNTLIEEDRQAIAEKDLFIKRLNELVDERKQMIDLLEEKVKNLEKEIATLRIERQSSDTQ